MAKIASKEIPNPIDAYLAGVPEPARTTLTRLRASIRKLVPKETTEGISYGIPAFKYKGPLIGFAAFPDHCSLFAMSGTALDAFADDLKSYSTSKGTVRFALDKPFPAALLKKLVNARIAENEARKK